MEEMHNEEYCDLGHTSCIIRIAKPRRLGWERNVTSVVETRNWGRNLSQSSLFECEEGDGILLKLADWREMGIAQESVQW